MLKKIERLILQIEKYVVYVLIVFIVGSTLYKMLARNFLTSEFAINLSDKISSLIPHCILLLGLVGASIGISRSEVISIDLFARSGKEKERRVLKSVVYFFTAALCFIFLVLAWQSREFGDVYWIWLGYLPALMLILLKSMFKVFSL
jgi:TRAP-type C4-dicarboxylate transport system permease small subunit